MEKIKVLEGSSPTLDYDEDADVLYISTKTPSPAVGVDIGEGVIIRYDEARGEVVGITVMGVRERVQAQLEG